MNSLNMGMEIPLLREGSGAEHAEVRLLPGMSHHVGLQHHLLVESFAAMSALEGPLTCVYSYVSDQLAGLFESFSTVMTTIGEAAAVDVFLVVSGARGERPHLDVTLHVLLEVCQRPQFLVTGLARVDLDA